MKKRKKHIKKIKYTKCVRCGSVAQIFIDMGKMGKIGLCPTCWIGLAGAMARDFEVYKKFDIDYFKELAKAGERENWIKKNKLLKG